VSERRAKLARRISNAIVAASTGGHGTGLRGMADRLEAVGGELELESAPDHGTTVGGRVPVGAGR
jgi:signal transduction histidine kinase